ncbi:DUF2142 domain-containing protein [Acetobacter indonesiensis]|uniref:DUF2142 domain-containing protein n=1 Tax=Acetobacter indonesiensis TaxID=104101 RepID=UPI0020A51A29|nr:DUF2142 domain-containing protein [Acetobacter indonesiensis]MCP1230069.1 DUF2142 domain-containing protein [Acetobacter indonesiensis]
MRIKSLVLLKGLVCLRKSGVLLYLYGFFMLIAGIECIVLTPPFQVADEFNHFMRAIQISEGHIVGIRRDPLTAGGILPSSLINMGQSFNYLKFSPDKKVDLVGLSDAYMTPWSQQTEFVGYASTVFYPPSSYAGVVLGAWCSHALGMRPLGTLYICRAISGLICFGLVMIALVLAGPIAPFLAIMLALPMSISLMASTSQDGILLALSALVCAILSRCFNKKDERVTKTLILLSGVLLACIAAAKMPYASLLFLPLCLMVRRGVSVLWPVISCCVGWLLFVGWAMLGIRPSITKLAPIGASPRDQIVFVLHHPLRMVTTVVEFVLSSFRQLLQEAIGVLGWLDTFFSPTFYYIAETCLTVCFLTMFYSVVRKPQKKNIIYAACVLFLLFASGTGIILALYVNWTPVAATHIDGVQGRYFLPLMLFLPIIVPLLAHQNSDKKNITRRRQGIVLITQMIACGFMVFSTFSLYTNLSMRFWP